LTRDFILVFLAFFTFVSADMALLPALPIYFAKSGSNAREVGILFGAIGVAALFSRFFVGAVLTRCSEKKVILIGITLLALAQPAYIIFRPFWPLFAVTALQGIAFASVHTAAFTYIVKTIPPARRGQGLAYFTLATYFAMAIAPPFGLFLVNRYDFTFFFLTVAGLCVCSFLLSSGADGEAGQNIQSHARIPDEPPRGKPRGISWIEWKILVPGVAAFLQMFVYGAVAAFFPLYALQCGVTNPGLFFTAGAVIVVVSRAFGGRILDTCNKEKMIMTLISIMMVSMVILSFSRTLSMFIFAGFLFGTGLAFFMPASLAYAFEYSGSSGGPAVATFNASYDLGMALGPAAMGLIVPLTGFPGMFLTLALISFINLCYFHFYVRKRCSMVLTG